MRTESTSPYPPLEPRNGVLVVDGYGIWLGVRHRHLVVSDGFGRYRREAAFSRATSGIKRLILLGHTGAVSLQAIRWMKDVGIGFVHLDADGTLLTTSATLGNDDARLRRAQALSHEMGNAQGIARWILGEKLKGQQRVLASLTTDREAGKAVGRIRVELGDARSSRELLAVEARAAVSYWEAWTEVSLTFARRDIPRLPEHWLSFGTRRSTLSGSPRLAVNPGNAMLNYLYRLLEAETRLACLTVGLDPGLGFFHHDKRGRDSLVMDLMEACRPQVDAFILRLLREQVLRRSDFHETAKGVCRILPPLSHQLAGTSVAWGRAVGPVVEQVARMLGKPRRIRQERVPTPITGSNRSAGRDGAQRRLRQARTPLSENPSRACRICGEQLKSRLRKYCDTCMASGSGSDGRESGTQLLRRATAMVRHQEEIAEWRAMPIPPPDPVDYVKEILPGLGPVAIREIMQATGLSEPYCYRIRRGDAVPHRRHWPALKDLTTLVSKTLDAE